MAQRHHHYSKVVGAFVRIPEPLEDGKIRCLGCSAVLTPTPNGKIRRHNSPAGEPCAYTSTSYAEPVHLDELPPVNIPEVGTPPGSAAVARRSPAEIAEDGRLAPRNNECVDCGRWLPGERTVCGKCARARNQRKGRA